MTSVFDAAGNSVGVTVLEMTPNVVTQVKSVETDGYDAIQVGYGDKKEKSTFHRMLSEKILETIGNSKNFKSKFEGKQNTITTVKTVKDKQQNLFINA